MTRHVVHEQAEERESGACIPGVADIHMRGEGMQALPQLYEAMYAHTCVILISTISIPKSSCEIRAQLLAQGKKVDIFALCQAEEPDS